MEIEGNCSEENSKETDQMESKERLDSPQKISKDLSSMKITQEDPELDEDQKEQRKESSEQEPNCKMAQEPPKISEEVNSP